MIKCAACRALTEGGDSSPDWESTLCDRCWSLTSRITRGWYVLVQRNGEAAGWPERLHIEHNILWDILVAQARQALQPPPPRQVYDPKRVRINLAGVSVKPRRHT